MIAGVAVGVLVIAAATLSDPPPQLSPVPVLEVIKVYGSLANSECFGANASPGSSCQLPLGHLQKKLFQETLSISREDFARIVKQSHFQWPLKPYGIDKSLSKTAIMNKGAETKIFMDELEARGLYDRRNPTGPLPTSLRPKLNQQLEQEGIDPAVVDRVFLMFNGEKPGGLTYEHIREAFQGKKALDYYSFVDLFGKESISWPY